jgi:hypothetical protein
MTSFDQAQRLRAQQRLVASRAKLEFCAAEPCLDVVREKCTLWLQEVHDDLASVVVRVMEPDGDETVDAEVRVDGEPVEPSGRATWMDPGDHVVHVTLHGTTHQRTVRLPQGSKNHQLLIRLPQSRPRSAPARPTPRAAPKTEEGSSWPLHPAAWVGISLVAASVVVGGVMGGIALERADDCRKQGCTQAEIDNAGTIADVSTGALVVAGVAAAATVAVVVITTVQHEGGSAGVFLSPSRAAFWAHF